jgi:Stage II sporulation protein E (SpoIIE)
LLAAPLHAQSPNPPAPTPQPPEAQITLGQSAVPLYGPWKFTVGDSPIDPATGKPLWAEPGFDDSHWETVDLTPDRLAANGLKPGWTGLGHPGYSGYAWYRTQLQVHPQPGEKLALAGPTEFDDAYQLFLNGAQIGEFGFSGQQPKAYFAQPTLFPLTEFPNVKAQPETQSVPTQVIAFRFWTAPATLVQQADAGGFHDAPLVGSAEAIALVNQVSWLALVKGQAATMLSGVIFTVLTGMAFVLFLYNPADRAYSWMTLSCSLSAAVSWEFALAALGHELFTVHTDLWFGNVLVIPFSRFCWLILMRAWFHLERPRWLPWTVALLTFLEVVAIAGTLGLIPQIAGALAPACAMVLSVITFLILLALSWVLYRVIRNSPVDGSLFLPIIIIGWMDWLGAVFPHMGLSRLYAPYGFTILVAHIEGFAIALTLCALLIRRWIHSVQNHRQMALDVTQAQEVQQVILPEAHITLPGLTIESVYRPAREVGGDFFQIIPHATDGSLLIVAGDVAGKGLQAGMLVALLVGAIRSTNDWTSDPALMLKALNQRLMGRGNAAATCLALRIAADGAATLANAGHLPPYLNGQPVAMEGALPLGIFAAAEPSLMHFQLNPGDRLVLISDGILEATNKHRELFGFERIATFLATRSSAASLADAAQSFGQDDDISVISVTRDPARELALA